MFGFHTHHQKEKKKIEVLKDELRKSRQEREAARLGLMTAVKRLLNEIQSIPIDQRVEMVSNDLAAVRRERGKDDHT